MNSKLKDRLIENLVNFRVKLANLIPKMAIIFSIFIIGLIAVTNISAQTVESDCSFSAWVTDKDVNGLNVRDKAGVDGKIIGKLKFAKDDDNIVIVNIIGYSNGWVKINRAETVGGEEQFSDIGWVSAKMVAVRTEQHNGSSDKPLSLYAKPKTSGKKIGTIPNEEDVEIVGFDCFGFKVKHKNKTGWLSADDMCGNPVTTCS